MPLISRSNPRRTRWHSADYGHTTMMKPGRILLVNVFLSLLLNGCGGARASVAPEGVAEPDLAPSDETIAAALAPSSGDLEAMRARRTIRLLVTFSRTNYFLDRGRQLGATYEAGHAFEEFVNKELKTGTVGIHVVFVPVRRDAMFKALEDGRGDMAAANLTITDTRQARADF